jgi:hypothetical protein
VHFVFRRLVGQVLNRHEFELIGKGQ